ncbi:alpha-ribazole phosphatase [Dyadobacter bucti]|uniref:alpha-ribazole phosphatase n=1 Tax=Dyadobacter bucti TaxID=2572203 RepID=UPI003F72BC73
MEIYLIRHTTPELTPGLIYGRLDVPLTSAFDEELELIKTKLPENFDVVYSSPATRCTILAKEIDDKFITDSRLTELHFGDWEGKTWDTVDQGALQIWMDDFVNVCVPRGESMLDLKKRVAEFWEDLRQKDHQKIAVVTHAGVIRMLLTLYRKSPLEDFFRIEVKYGDVTRVSL